ncbi:MAG TPA: sialidase family protein, partial [Steroidobacteraceae bacterium]|nr:sialidase family protein [Steroidobacteraceae bacterium]
AYEPAGVHFFRSTDGGASFGEPVPLDPAAAVSDAPAMTRTGEHVFVAWHAKTGGERRIHYRIATGNGTQWGTVNSIEPEGLKGNSSYPSVAALAGERVVLSWQQGDEIVATTLTLADGPAPPTLTSRR